jgi:NAD(P)-dependent dehydrogenase (short-subunit alcohol dehydrogenase family)
MAETKPLAGKVAIVTGAGKNIDKATVAMRAPRALIWPPGVEP